MLWFVAIIAIVNLLLGYGLAVLTGARHAEIVPTPDSNTIYPHPSEVPTYPTDSSESAPSPPANAPIESTPTSEAASRLATREHAEQLLAEIAQSGSGANPVTVALLELNNANQLDQALDERLLHGVTNTIHELLADVGTVARYGDQQLLLTLPQDAAHEAAERTEQIRQRIQATQFVADGKDIQTTVTCALVDVVDQPVLQLLEYLEETLAEARRCGGNRTFLHDGTAAAPVVPQELSFPSQKCAI